MILFEAQIQEHQSLAQHYRELAAKREALAAELLGIQEQADASLTGLKGLLEKCRGASPNAIASLKSAVVSLFNDGDNDSGGNQPDSPTPPDNPESDEADEPELLCLNGITGDFLVSSDEPEADESVSLGVLCCEFASPICCQLEDAPQSSLMGQSYELCSLVEDAPKPFVELVIHPDNPNVAHIRKTADGQILTAYFGFRTKAIAQSWKEFLEAIAHRIEYRKAKQVPGVTWEIKCWGMAMNQIDRLAKNCDFTKIYQIPESPAQAAGIEPPSNWGKVNTIPVLEENDICEVLMGKFTGQVGTVASISQYSEKPIALNLPGGHIKHFLRSELKFISKGEPKSQRQQLQTGDVLMGSRVVTTGAFVGVSATVRANNAARGLETKLAAAQLLKSGLSPELAMAAATGTVDDASDF